MLDVPLIAAGDPGGSTDLLARWVGFAGLVVAMLALVLGAYREWRDRARLEVELSTSTMGTDEGLNYLDAVVRVRNPGRRPTSVEQIHFDRADGAPEVPLVVTPVRLPGFDDLDIRASGINAQQPPVSIGEGDVRIWMYRILHAADHTPWTGSWPPPTTPMRAVVRSTKGKVIRSEAVGFWLRPCVPPGIEQTATQG